MHGLGPAGDEHWMRRALDEARAAGEAGEVPVGAVLVRGGVIVATGRNAPVASHDPCGHAEIRALRAGAAALGNYRLDGCELFVTLEPCAMCAGAILHARLARVVYGARDPKTGAAGSVIDLFGLPQLNHRTQVRGDVLADMCADVLQSFFRERRRQSRELAQPLRDDALRTPDERFAGLADHGFRPSWSMEALLQDGWRFRWLDSSANGYGFSTEPVICLHGPGQWGYLFRHLLAVPGIRWLAPDLLGFGRSDKPKREATHNWEWHRDVLLEWLDGLRLPPVRIVHAKGAELLVKLLREAGSDRIADAPALVVPDARSDDAVDAWRAPFPDRGHEAALRALGKTDAATSGPTPEQAFLIGRQILGETQETMGYCRP